MNKTALKNFALNARKELIEKVKAKGFRIGITEENIKKAQFESSDAVYIDGKQLSATEKKQREELIFRIKEFGYKQVLEEVAYTWFNRFIALRYMEVNDYLPTRVRVLSSSNIDSAEPDIINFALKVDLDIDYELVYDLKLNNKIEELFKYLVIKQCNSLNDILPFMFGTIDNYKELLFPEGLLSKDSFIRQMTNIEIIQEDDWMNVEIIGWLYQYYNTEMYELVYNGEMSKSKITKELLPAGTQLFTPEWAVQYMVENSLGRLWIDENPDDELKKNLKYFLDKDESNFKKELYRNKSYYKQLNPENIKLIDPCMGSGHILVHAYEVLMKIYESCGYLQRDAAKLILEKNLYGLEIDDRAYQLSCFALMMKARKYNRRIFNEEISLNLCAISESNELFGIDIRSLNLKLKDRDIETANYLIEVYLNSKEYGSILNIEERDYDSLENSLIDLKNTLHVDDLFKLESLNNLNDVLPKLLMQAKIMSQKYDIVITNPPYLGSGRMSPLLSEYVKEYYPNTKSDLSMVMYQKALDSYSKPEGYISFITTTSWMFLRSFENFRENVLKTIQFDTLVDFGTELFDGKVGHNPIVSWVNKKSAPKDHMLALRLVDFCYSKREQKKTEYFNLENRFYSNQLDYHKIPGSPIVYWTSKNIIDIFNSNKKLGEVIEAKVGLQTGGNDNYIKLWHEVNYQKIGFDFGDSEEALRSNQKFFPYNKGGAYRKWYGNQEYVINWQNNGEMISKNEKAVVRNPNYYFKESVSWSDITSYKSSFRYYSKGFIFDSTGHSSFPNENMSMQQILAICNNKFYESIIKILNPTLHFHVGYFNNLPAAILKEDLIKYIVDENISISKNDWDAFETSWGFRVHPLLKHKQETIKLSFQNWSEFAERQFKQMESNEKKLNQIFIDTFDLESDYTPEVAEKDITIRKAKFERDIKSFISYAIGCLFGRYSLDQEGLVYAGGEFDPSCYITFPSDQDNILPVVSSTYHEKDIVTSFIEFVKVSFGEKSLTENLDYITGALGKKDGDTVKETLRSYFLNDFYKDHFQTYKKRPIYWLFTSGKQKAFNCFIYMHRYDKSTLSRIRTDYLHELQIRMDAEKKTLLDIINGDGTTKEIANVKKELKSLDLKIEELRAYDEKLHHMADMQIEIDLDDGITANYAKFEGLLAPIK